MARPKGSTNLVDVQKKWEERIRKAKKAHKDWGDEFKVGVARQFYEGKQNTQGWADHEWITVNKIWSHMQAQLPILYSLDPFFYIKLKRSFDPDPNQIPIFDKKGESLEYTKQRFVNGVIATNKNKNFIIKKLLQ